jgi:hypothetical protein
MLLFPATKESLLTRQCQPDTGIIPSPSLSREGTGMNADGIGRKPDAFRKSAPAGGVLQL